MILWFSLHFDAMYKPAILENRGHCLKAIMITEKKMSNFHGG